MLLFNFRAAFDVIDHGDRLDIQNGISGFPKVLPEWKECVSYSCNNKDDNVKMSAYQGQTFYILVEIINAIKTANISCLILP